MVVGVWLCMCLSVCVCVFMLLNGDRVGNARLPLSRHRTRTQIQKLYSGEKETIRYIYTHSLLLKALNCDFTIPKVCRREHTHSHRQIIPPNTVMYCSSLAPIHCFVGKYLSRGDCSRSCDFRSLNSTIRIVFIISALRF